MIMPGAEPFFWPGGEHGVLLVHGFTGIPTELVFLGKYLHERGFTVLAVRLAGHGTSVADLVQTTGEDWLDSVRDGYALLSGCVKKISVVGHSMGGALALVLAAEKNFHRIVTLAAPIFIHQDTGIAGLPPRDTIAGQSVPKKRRRLKDVPPVVNKTYRQIPLSSVYELLDIIEREKQCLPKVTAPLFVIHSHGDHTADPAGAAYIYEHAGSAVKEILWLDDVGHLLPLAEQSQRERIFARTAEFLQR